jgi:hypothetical protein
MGTFPRQPHFLIIGGDPFSDADEKQELAPWNAGLKAGSEVRIQNKKWVFPFWILFAGFRILFLRRGEESAS